MKNTAPYIVYSFLTYINTIDVLIGKYLDRDEYQTHYSRIARLFGIRDKELLDTYRKVLASDLVSGADRESKFNLLCRAIEFSPHKFSEDMRTVVNYRISAIDIKKKIAENGDSESLDGIISGMGHLALAGEVGCMVMLAYMKLYGIFVKKDVSGAIKLIRNAALWNDPLALILGMKHDKNKAAYPSVIKAIFTSASQDEAYKHLERHLEIPEDTEVNSIALALEKRFYNKLSGKDRISQPIIDVIHSKVLNESSKVHLIETASKDPDFSALPLNLTRKTPIALPKKLSFKRPCGRENEIATILSNFALYSHSRTSTAEYKPLLIICPDEYTLDSFEQAIIKSFHQNSIIRVDLKCTPPSNFSPLNDNPIVSEMNSYTNACVAVLIEGCSELSETCQADLVRFLRASAKRELHQHHNLRFDYSGILPILTATSAVAPELMAECDVVKLAPAKENDKSELIRGIIDDKKQVFKLESISIDDEAIRSLARHPLSTISSVIDRAVSLKAEDGHALITHKDIAPLLPKKIGFDAGSFWV